MNPPASQADLTLTNVRLVTPSGPGPHRGAAMRALRAEPANVIVRGGRVTAIEPASIRSGPGVIDAGGRVLMPAFVDCHTHACWCGQRLDEWERKLAGATYMEILASGGGIMSTVRAVRSASDGELEAALTARLREFAAAGTGTVEVKSGYGLSTPDELRMLRAIAAAARRLNAEVGLTVIPTALLGHAIDAADSAFVDRTVNETLPAVHAEFPGIAIDAFLEKGAWSLQDCTRLLGRARELGHPVRLHADQFTSLGGLSLAASLHAASVDHLEASTPSDLAQLATSSTIGVALPLCGMHLDGRYAALRPLVDAGGAAAIATNFNPGSAPGFSMPLVIALAVRHCGLTVSEAITASTANAAAALGLADRGWIGPGARADLILLTHDDERRLAFELGTPQIGAVWLAGAPVSPVLPVLPVMGLSGTR